MLYSQNNNTGGSFNPYRYNSQRLDVSGLYYLRARQYSSGIGRFLTHDSMMGSPESPIAQHRYLYGNDDPVNIIDPNGRMGIIAQTAIIATMSTLLVTSVTDLYISRGNQNIIDLATAATNAANYSFPDITEPLKNVLADVKGSYANASPINRERAKHTLVSPTRALGAWDIADLTNSGNGDEWIVDAVNNNGGQPPLKNDQLDMRFVVVDGETFHSYSVNYVIFGEMMKLAGWSRSTMKTYIWGSKARFAFKDYKAALEWAEAGYDGWADGNAPTPTSNIISQEPISYEKWVGQAPFSGFSFDWWGLR